MRIERFWAKGYRSLADLDLDGLGPFNVFYGRNGAGKSNILAAMELLFRAVAARAQSGYSNLDHPVSITGLVEDGDFCLQEPTGRMVLGARLESSARDYLFRYYDDEVGHIEVGRIDIEVVIQRDQGSPAIHLSKLLCSQSEALSWWSDPQATELKRHFGAFLRDVLGALAFRLVPATRVLGIESESKSGDPIRHLLDRGAFKEALVAAQLSPDPVIRKRLKMLRDLLAGEPLRRPPFVPVLDPKSRQYGLHEVVTDQEGTERSMPLELGGLGLQQLYFLLGHTLLGASFAVGLEEPEAHLHAPTTGRDLRTLLKRVVDEGMVQQLFIATHSNLFDLDPTGWFDVSLENGATRVVRRTDLAAIDAKHLYEPGPARHGLQDMLRFLSPETVVFRRADDGKGISAAEMLDLLQRDAPEAVDFLHDVHDAAVRAVQMRAGRPR